MSDQSERTFLFSVENPNTRTLFDVVVSIEPAWPPAYCKVSTAVDGVMVCGSVRHEDTTADLIEHLLRLGAEEVTA